jgi:hypothetical protein
MSARLHTPFRCRDTRNPTAPEVNVRAVTVAVVSDVHAKHARARGRPVRSTRTSTRFSVERAAQRYRSSGDPAAERMIGMLESPPSLAEVVEQAERLEFSG